MSPRSESDKNSDSDSSSQNKRHRSSSRKTITMEKGTEEYKHRREKNNLAVKKCRNKSKMKTQETLDRVNSLKAENSILEGKIKLLTKELGFLKDLFLSHAGNSHEKNLQAVDWDKVLSSDDVLSLMQRDGENNVNDEAVQNDHKYTIHANIKVQV